MNGIRRLLYLTIFLLLPIQSAGSLCNMPTAWHGLWYQRGMNSLLEITIDHIQTKGRCIDGLPTQQYYLFTDRINRCTRCLLFIERDTNLLQYRESECSDADELSNATLCPNVIAPDAPLYTLHRNNSKPQLCPIQPPFSFIKLIKDGSQCQSSLSSSYIGECVNDYQFRLHLSPCSSHHDKLDLQLLCVGTWIEGFHTYFVTRIISKQHHYYNYTQYACFYYITKEKDMSSSFSLSMATDGSCRDLNSRHMATVMTLSSINRHMGNESNMSCTFPDEYQQYEWYSLNRTTQMIVRNNDIELINLEKNEHNQRFHCLQSINSSYFRIRTFTNCDSNDRCLRIYQRTNNVLELIISHCHHSKHSKVLTFVKKSNYLSSCPNSIGHLLLESNLNQYQQLFFRNNIVQMSVGCENKDKIIIYEIDKGVEYRSLTQMDTCLASWQSDDLSSVYVIAQSNSSNASYCLKFQMSDLILIRNNSHSCSFDSYEDRTSISMYSATLINPCSRSSQSLLNCFLLLITIILLVNDTR